MAWQVSSGYNQRSRAETQMGRWKMIIGPKLKAHSFPDQRTEVNQTGFTGEQKAWKVSDEQRKIREPFFDRSECARGAFGAGE